MSHTLHRVAGNDGLIDDYIILVMPASKYNKDETTPAKLGEYLKIIMKHSPVNMGGMGIGQLCDGSTLDDMLARLNDDIPMIHAVFDSRENLVKVLKDIKDAELGLSVIASGLVDSVDCCAKEIGLKRHSINYSMGIWGDTSRLPDEKTLQIATMCGHAMISFNLVAKTVEDIRKGKTTADQAAVELAKFCVCGIFNPVRAKRLLEEFI